MDFSRQYPIEPHARDETDLIFQLQCLEKEAYNSVLRAFGAQSDHISWAKVQLMTELRQELNVTDAEHRELLREISSDESIKRIRDWKNSTRCVQGYIAGELNASGPASDPMDRALYKKGKISYASDPRFHKQEPQCQAFSGIPPLPIPAPPDGEGRRIVKIVYQAPPSFDPSKKIPDVIKIRETKQLLHEVDSVDHYDIESVIYGRKGTDPVQVEKAKQILNDHEQSLLSALANLSDVSDDDDSPAQMLHHFPYGEVKENKQQIMTHNDFHGQAGRLYSYPPESYQSKKSYPLRRNNPTSAAELNIRLH